MKTVCSFCGSSKRWSLTAIIVLAALSTGCLANRRTPDIVYLPPATTPAHAVHLKSFNSLSDLVEPKQSWLDVLRGGAASPFVARPSGVEYKDHKLFVCDAESAVIHVWNLDTGEASLLDAEGQLQKPVAIAVDEAGTVFVADTKLSKVISVTQVGSIVQSFKPPDRERFRPVALGVKDDRLFVADIESLKLDVFSTSDGLWIKSIDLPENDDKKKALPMGIAFDNTGRVFVSDMMGSRVITLNEDGSASAEFGQAGNRYGDLGKPRGIAIGPDGILFVADSDFAHVNLFDDQTSLLMVLGGTGHKFGSTAMPVDIAIAPTLPKSLADWIPDDFRADYFVFVANSLGVSRINLFAIGKSR